MLSITVMLGMRTGEVPPQQPADILMDGLRGTKVTGQTWIDVKKPTARVISMRWASKSSPAATYSPTPLPEQYHRRCGA
jgi:hypothetical protein